MEEIQFWKEMMIMLAFLAGLTFFIMFIYFLIVNLWDFLKWLWMKR